MSNTIDTGARQPDAIVETPERLTEADVANLRAQVRVETYREISDEVERRGFPLLAASLRRAASERAVSPVTMLVSSAHPCSHRMVDVITAEEIDLADMLSHLKCIDCDLHIRGYRGDPA
jgi:hypothetical protein